MAKPHTSLAEFPSLQKLQAALSAKPDADAELSALQAACDRFDRVQQALPTTTYSQYARAITDAKKRATEVQAKFDVGTATAGDLAAAKKALSAAQEALEMAPGRRDVIVSEMEVAEVAIAATQAKLREKLGPWYRDVEDARRQLEADAATLTFAAAEAFAVTDPSTSAGSIAGFVAQIPVSYGGFAHGKPLLPIPVRASVEITRARALLDGAERRQDRLVDVINSLFAAQREADLRNSVDREEIVRKQNQPPTDPNAYVHQVGRQ